MLYFAFLALRVFFCFSSIWISLSISSIVFWASAVLPSRANANATRNKQEGSLVDFILCPFCGVDFANKHFTAVFFWFAFAKNCKF